MSTEKSLGISLKKKLVLKNVSESVSKNYGTEKRLWIGIFKILGLVTHWTTDALLLKLAFGLYFGLYFGLLGFTDGDEDEDHDHGYLVMKVLVMKVMIVKEVITGDASPVALFFSPWVSIS